MAGRTYVLTAGAAPMVRRPPDPLTTSSTARRPAATALSVRSACGSSARPTSVRRLPVRDRASSGAPKRALQALDARGDGRLAHEELVRSGADAPRAGDGNEGVELRELDVIGHPCMISVLIMDVIGRIVLTDGCQRRHRGRMFTTTPTQTAGAEAPAPGDRPMAAVERRGAARVRRCSASRSSPSARARSSATAITPTSRTA